MSKDDILTIRVGKDDKAVIQKIAETKGLTSSSLVRMWIKEKIGETLE